MVMRAAPPHRIALHRRRRGSWPRSCQLGDPNRRKGRLPGPLRVALSLAARRSIGERYRCSRAKSLMHALTEIFFGAAHDFGRGLADPVVRVRVAEPLVSVVGIMVRLWLSGIACESPDRGFASAGGRP